MALNMQAPLYGEQASSSDAPTLITLPWDVFADIVVHLLPIDAFHLRGVCRATRNLLKRNDLSIRLIVQHFPRAREGRILREYIRNGRSESLDSKRWSAVFAILVRRYVHLGQADPWKSYTVPMHRMGAHLLPFVPFYRFLRYGNAAEPLYSPEALWTFDPEPGLLIYPGEPIRRCNRIYCLYALDFNGGKSTILPFDSAGRVLRRLRLRHGILIIEWFDESLIPLDATGRPFPSVKQHYVTAFETKRVGDWDEVMPAEGDRPFSWAFCFRAEWRLALLGPSIDTWCDRLYSDHNATHYVAYIWKFVSDRAPTYEVVCVWDMRCQSATDGVAGTFYTNAPLVGNGPQMIRRFNRDYIAYRLTEQGGAPAMISIRLDECTWDETLQSVCGHFYITEEYHPWIYGAQIPDERSRMHSLLVTGMPLNGIGPEWYESCGLPDEDEQRVDISGLLCKKGPRSSANTCSEADSVDLIELLNAMEDEDAMEYDMEGGAATGAASRNAYTYRRLKARARRALRGIEEPDDDRLMLHDLDAALPRRTPCWRHDEFPFLHVAQVFDAAAGVRITARTDLVNTSNAIYSHTRYRALRVESKVEAVYTAAGTRDGDEDVPVLFAGHVWDDVMARRVLAGDERWVVGESVRGMLTVLLF